MESTKKVFDFLEKAGTFYLATVEGDQPRVRPYGAILYFEDKIYIMAFGKTNATYQIAANQKAEICAFKDGAWIRVAGKLIEDDNRDARVSMLDAYPDLKNMYSPDDGNTEVFYFEDATATISSFTAAPEVIKF